MMRTPPIIGTLFNMTAGIFLCPTLTEGNPADEPAWVRIEYVGVPPGRKARAAVWLRNETGTHWIHKEGWPEKQRTGRTIDRLRVGIEFREDGWAVTENGEPLFRAPGKWPLPFDTAHVYLQMSSHSNYPPREIFFDNITFR